VTRPTTVAAAPFDAIRASHHKTMWHPYSVSRVSLSESTSSGTNGEWARAV
jgi:hypothetical protein